MAERAQSSPGWWKGIAVATVTTLMCAGAAELGLRMAGFRFAEPPLGDSELGMPLQAPHTTVREEFKEYGDGYILMRTNNWSFFRDRDVSLTKRPGVRRVLVLGDSQTEGLCMNSDSYPQQLEEILNGGGAERFEVINGGISKFSPYQYYVRLVKHLLPLKPDHVVVALYLGNDIQDLLRRDDRPYLTVGADGGVRAQKPQFMRFQDPARREAWPSRIRLWGLVQAALGPTLMWEIRRAAIMFTNLPEGERSPVNVGAYMRALWKTSQASHGIATQTMNQHIWFQRFPKTRQAALTVNGKLMEMFQDLSRREGFRLSYVLIPTKIQVEPEDTRETFEQLRRIDAGFTAERVAGETNRFEAEVLEQARRLGVEAVALREPLVARRGGRRLYYQRDMHLNPEGNRAVAEVLGAWLNGDTEAREPVSARR